MFIDIRVQIQVLIKTRIGRFRKKAFIQNCYKIMKVFWVFWTEMNVIENMYIASLYMLISHGNHGMVPPNQKFWYLLISKFWWNWLLIFLIVDDFVGFIKFPVIKNSEDVFSTSVDIAPQKEISKAK